MDLLVLVFVLCVIGFGVWWLTTNNHIPMPPGWAKAIQVLTFIVIVLYILTRFVSLPNVLPR